VRSSIRIALALAVMLSLALPGASLAAVTVENTNPEGPGSLYQAIEDAGPGGTVLLPAGVYTLPFTLGLNQSVTISGHGAGDTIVRAGMPNRVFDVSGANTDATISGVTIRDGNGVSSGAGIHIGGGATLTLREAVVTANVADADGEPGQFGGLATGGGIYNESGTLHLIDSVVSGNRASAVGGSGKFGGISEGGGIASEGPFTISGSTIAGNIVDSRGGQGPSNAEQFGGIAIGGGLFANLHSAGASVSATTISGNLADSSEGPGGFAGIPEGGGVLILESSTELSLTNLTIAANQARGPGGQANGGGLYFEGSSPVGGLTVTSSTISGNSADQGIGGGGNVFWAGKATPSFRNTIVSGGAGPAGTENCSQKATSLGFNLESADQCGFGAAGDQINADPKLGPLQDNGGRTATMAPGPTSPAVDRGSISGLPTDQRGIQRPIEFPQIPDSPAAGGDGSDIGGFELQPASGLALGRLQRNRRKGTATLTVTVPVPGNGIVTLLGKGLRMQSAPVADIATIQLPVIVAGKKVAKALRRRGRRKVGIVVTYAPVGNSAVSVSRKATLVRKAHKKKRKKKGRRH
jgi:hypothetical protein